MTERPILFSAPMVRAILDGTKTQTRRVVKPQPIPATTVVGTFHHPDDDDGRGPRFWSGGPDPSCPGHNYIQPDWAIPCPYGQPGDRLWVREAFAIVPRTAYRCSEGVQQTLRPDDDHDAAIYRAGWERSRSGFRWRPSIHMPRWASRLTLEITGVRVERLKDITGADAAAEGIERRASGFAWYTGRDAKTSYTTNPITSYSSLWESINGADSWDANPWLWVVEFKRVTP